MVLEVDQPGVLLTGRDCALIDRALRVGLAQLAVRDGASPAGVAQVTAAILAAAAEFRFREQRRRSTAGSGTEQVPKVAPVTDSATNGWETTKQVAERYDVDESYVRRLARQRRFVARRNGRGAWMCDAASVAVWAASRQDRDAA